MEKEIKIHLLSQEDYQKVINNLTGLINTEEQINYYFDTSNHNLRDNHIMLRLRKKGDKNILTFKRGISLENGYFQAEEKEVVISNENASNIFKNPAVLKNYFDAPILSKPVCASLKLLGNIKTIRSRYHFQDFIIEIDKITFPNENEDYEIEIETDNPGKARIIIFLFLDSYNIKYMAQKYTKYERFLENLK